MSTTTTTTNNVNITTTAALRVHNINKTSTVSASNTTYGNLTNIISENLIQKLLDISTTAKTAINGNSPPTHNNTYQMYMNNQIYSLDNQPFYTTNNSNNNSNNTNMSHQVNFLDILVVIIYILVFIIGVTGNLLVCRYFKFDNKRIKHLQLLIFYLAIADLCASITNPILFIYFQLTGYRAWHFGVIGCKLFPLTWRMFTSLSVGIIMVINIDRCLALKFPFRREPTKKQINMIVTVIFMVSVLMETPYLIYARVEQSGSKVICNVPSVSVAGYGYPRLCIMISRDLLYLAVFIISFVVIKAELAKGSRSEYNHARNARASKTGIAGRWQSQYARNQENKRVLNMLLAVATAFVVSVFPRELLHIVYTISWLRPSGFGIMQTPALNHTNTFLTSLMCCNTICNVVIYAKLHRKFRFTVVTVFSVSLVCDKKSDSGGAIVAGQNGTAGGGSGGSRKSTLLVTNDEQLLNDDDEDDENTPIKSSV